jgi:hypothetical protein|tara:strand:- start:88 stop:294 length:207 start_codon:yes stop_codon:yes gene_type:complete
VRDGGKMSREELLREWIEENKDIEPEVCELVGFTLDQIKLTTDEYKKLKYWDAIKLFMREIDNYPIRR